MSYTINDIYGQSLYVAEGASDVKAALEAAVREDGNLRDANLRRACLEGAYLGGAYLRGADLRGAYLRRADLSGAYLRGANLRRACLEGAYLGGAYLRGADLSGAYLRGACLEGADLSGAYLRGAYLRGADLSGANLRGACLEGADLRGANLRRACLEGADLRGAKGLQPEMINDLLMLYDQVGKIRAYKLVKPEGQGPFNGGITYEVGRTYEVKDADTDPAKECGAGINLATLPWCLANWQKGYRVLVCEFTRADIAAIPVGDGKFRVRKCRVVAEKDISELVG